MEGLKPLQEELYSYPVVTCLVGNDGQEDHTVTIYKEWIFDGNWSHALALNEESLNEICSSDKKM